MTLILINKHCTFIKTFLYKYSIIAWIKVIYEALEKGDFVFPLQVKSTLIEV